MKHYILSVLSLISLLVFISCGDSSAPVAGGWTDTQNGIQARIVDQNGNSIQSGYVIATRKVDLLSALVARKPFLYDSIYFQNGTISKVWNDTFSRSLKVVAGNLQYSFASSFESYKLDRVELGPVVSVVGYTNSGFDQVYVLGDSIQDRVDGKNMFVLSNVALGSQTLMLIRGDSAVFGANINVVANSDKGYISDYNLFACPDNSAIASVKDLMTKIDQSEPWLFPVLMPNDTLFGNGVVLSGSTSLPYIENTVNGNYSKILTKNGTFSMTLDVGFSQIRFFDVLGNDQCLGLFVKP